MFFRYKFLCSAFFGRSINQESLHELHEAQRKAGREPANLENEENHHPLQEHSREIREAAKV